MLSFDKDAVLEDSFCQVLDEDEYYSSGQRKDSGWFDLVLAVTPVVAPALGGLLYPSIETLYHVVSDVLSFRLWESADGGFAQTQALIPLVNGIVVPACSVALGTLTALTVSQLRQRQIQLRTLLNKEACLIRCILCTFEALFQARCAPPPLHHRRLASPSASITSSSTSARAMSSGPRGGAATPARWKRAVGAARGRCPVSPPWGPQGGSARSFRRRSAAQPRPCLSSLGPPQGSGRSLSPFSSSTLRRHPAAAAVHEPGAVREPLRRRRREARASGRLGLGAGGRASSPGLHSQVCTLCTTTTSATTTSPPPPSPPTTTTTSSCFLAYLDAQAGRGERKRQCGLRLAHRRP